MQFHRHEYVIICRHLAECAQHLCREVKLRSEGGGGEGAIFEQPETGVENERTDFRRKGKERLPRRHQLRHCFTTATRVDRASTQFQIKLMGAHVF